MTPEPCRSPRVEILGVYSPCESQARYEQAVAEYAASCDPAMLSARMREVFIRSGRDVEPLTEAELKEAEAPFRLSLSNAVYIEALVVDVDARYDAGEFIQPDPSIPQGQWQVAWNATYLSLDGETVLSGYPDNKAPKESTLRVVFVIHCWNPALPLSSSYGNLRCPPPLPMPDRLWRLVPYETVD